jgi:hypothetical protein
LLKSQLATDRRHRNAWSRRNSFRGHPSKELQCNRLAFSFVKIREFSQRIVKQNRVQARRFSKIYPRF